jgi:hypothetical protein
MIGYTRDVKWLKTPNTLKYDNFGTIVYEIWFLETVVMKITVV